MLRRIRLITGLTLFVYIATHTLPLILGNHSLAVMEAVRPYWHAPWETWLGQLTLYGAILTHMSLGLYAVYRRRRWRGITRGEAVQLVFGLSVPALLALHLVSTRIAALRYGIEPTYPWIMAIYLKYDPVAGWRQATVFLVAWTHGCMGLYYWLRLKPSWPKMRFGLYAAALLWPALAMTGFYKAGSEAAELTVDPGWVDMVLRYVGNLNRAAQADLYRIEDWILIGLGSLLLGAVAARLIRQQIEKRRGLVTLRYEDGREYRFNQGLTILEASRECNYPHASVCGGRGRCSTCRIRVRHGAELLPPASEAEKRVLRRIRAAEDVRLACQSIPAPGRIEVTPLLPPNASAKQGHARSDMLQGKEATIAVMFCDLRGFTRLSEDRLPYDTVFLLNRYFDAMGRAIEESGGHLDKFIGDGIMALFGIEQGQEAGCRDALKAAQRMAERLAALNDGLSQDLDEPLRIGIGIHVGTVIVGEMGYGRATQLTAIGDAVNTASRLEATTKELAAQLVASRAVFRAAGIDYRARDWGEHEIEIRGRVRPIHVVAVPDAMALADSEAAEV